MYKIKSKKTLYSRLEEEGVTKSLLQSLDNLIYRQYEYHRDHSDNIDKYMRVFAEKISEYYPELKWGSFYIDILCLGSLIHDIGKLSIPHKLLSKKGQFTKNEYKTVKIHPKAGVKLIEEMERRIERELGEVDRVVLNIIKNMTLYHHERENGTGYLQLEGRQIPMEAKLMGIVDTFDAMTSKRCYEITMGQRAAIEKLKELSDLYDKNLVDIFEKSIFLESNYKTEVEKQ